MIALNRPRAGVVALVCGLALAASPAGDFTDGFAADLLLAGRHYLAPQLEPKPSGRVVVVAIDEKTYAVPPFRDLPLALWAPFQAELLDALMTGGAALVGYDFIFATSTETTLKGYDRGFRLALRRAATSDRIVLGEFLGGPGLVPHPSYVFTVGGAANLRPLDVTPDPDGVMRAVPLSVSTPEGQLPTLAGELARRLGASLDLGPRGSRLRLDLGAERQTVPVYSFADLYECATVEERGFFAKHFAGKVVLLGVDLAVEDRHRAANRFLPAPDAQPQAPCSPRPEEATSIPSPGSMGGVFLHAAAIDQLLSGTNLVELGPLASWSFVFVAALLAVVPPLAFQAANRARSPLYALMPLCVVLGAVALADGVVLPTGRTLLAMGTSFAIAFLHRAGVIDRDRWRLSRTLGLYLPEAEISRLHASGQVPELGGETRTVTIVFVDVANFSRIAEATSPAEITARLNAHFERLSVAIERHGGIIDRYVGDAVVALFGAPVPHPDHAQRAVLAACEIGVPSGSEEEEHAPFQVRVGVTTGPVLVGNIGSRRRFNYTAIGDTVNLASRIEGLNKVYGSVILVSRTTVEGCSDVAFREVDRVRVVGRAQPVDLFVPLGAEVRPGPAEDVFARGLRLYRARAFDAAAAVLEEIAGEDVIARSLLERCRRFQTEPPPAAWDGTFAAETK